MTPEPDVPQRRRTLLRLMGAAAGAGALGRVAAQEEDHESGSTDDGSESTSEDGGSAIVLEQGDRCVELEPISGSAPVEDLYDFTYPTQRFVGPPGSQGTSYSSEGTVDLQRDRTSILFAYDGPEGLSLVVVHGHVGGETDAGGTVTFAIDGVPASAEWVVMDDYYLEDGEPAPSNHDRWDVGGTTHVIDWGYRGGRTDGGALRGLGDAFDVTVQPAFNDAAALAGELSYGPIEAWEALSGDRSNPERFPLRLDQPVRLRIGTCGDPAQEDGEGDEEETGETEETEETEETDGDQEAEEGGSEEEETDDTDDRQQTKHERKQRKHQEKHERKQRKHQRKHEKKQEKHRKKQRKHQRKHERKQRKHQRKHERKQRKHRREQRKHDRDD